MVTTGARGRIRSAARALGRLAAGALVLAAAVLPAAAVGAAAPSGASPPPRWTTSHYEGDARRASLYRQGEAAGRSSAQGIVILDFGRPAERDGVEGTIGFDGGFLPLTAVAAAVRSYVSGYYRTAPSRTSLDVAVGTNNSCGTAQPCGWRRCGCRYEPASYLVWGEQLASTVEQLAAWTSELRAGRRYTDDVQVVGADDIEPAYDPGYVNTYDLLKGYALAVGGTAPAMVDYGSADPHFWSEARLFQVAYGFAPDVPMPEIYYADQARQWADLLRYAAERLRRPVTIFGVLTTGSAGTNPPQQAYADMLGAASAVSRQRQIRWLSSIAPTRVPIAVR